MKEIIIATTNRGKVKEFAELLKGVFENIFSLIDFDSVPSIVEDGGTFGENALKKAQTVATFTGRTTLADDSGLEVEVLGGRPGIFSARYAGENVGDKQNINMLLEELSDKADRNARFVCSLALVFPDGQEIVVEGTCAGIIVDEPRGEGGFGYDPVFFLPELGKTMAELAPHEKNLVSHRARAVKALVLYLNGRTVGKSV